MCKRRTKNAKESDWQPLRHRYQEVRWVDLRRCQISVLRVVDSVAQVKMNLSGLQNGNESPKESCISELNDDLDVVGRLMKRIGKVLRLLASRHQLRKPCVVGTGENLPRLEPMPFVGVHAPDDRIIF